MTEKMLELILLILGMIILAMVIGMYIIDGYYLLTTIDIAFLIGLVLFKSYDVYKSFKN